MSANVDIVEKAHGPSTLVRPRFGPGLLLRDDDLRVGVDYTRELSRLLFRSLFGCGVVCGLRVTSVIECGKLVVTVQEGVALDCRGDPIHVPQAASVKIDPTCDQEIPGKLWVTLCRTEKCCAPRSAACACDEDDGGSVCTREHDGFEIRVVKKIPEKCICKEELLPTKDEAEQRKYEGEAGCWCADPCLDCHREHYEGECGCGCCEDCVVLAVLINAARLKAPGTGADTVAGSGSAAEPDEWIVNHSVRRFVRPVLMRDPVVHGEQYPKDLPCNGTGEPVMAEDQHQHAMMMAMAGDVAAADEAAQRAAWATRNALRRGIEVRAAAAAGRYDEAEAAAKAAEKMAVEAELSAKAVAERATEAAIVARRAVEKVAVERKAAEMALSAKLTGETAADEASVGASGRGAATARAAPRRARATTKKTTPPAPSAS